MTHSIRSCKLLLLALLIGAFPFVARSEQITKYNVTIVYDTQDDGSILVRYAQNKAAYRITIVIDGEEQPAINANSSAQIQKIARKIVRFESSRTGGMVLWRFEPPKIEEPLVEEPALPVEEPSPTVEEKPEPAASLSAVTADTKKHVDTGCSAASNGGDMQVSERINKDSFFGQNAVNAYVRKCDLFVAALSESTNKEQFIIDNDLIAFLSVSESELNRKRQEISSIAQGIIASAGISESSRSTIANLVIETLDNRLNQRERAFIRLKTAVDSLPAKTSIVDLIRDNILNYSIVCGIVLALLLWMILAIIYKQRKSKSRVSKAEVHAAAPVDGNPAIVVRRRTTSILKKQSLEDVIGNPAYLVLSSSDFTADSAIGKIYVKNTCIKEVYNLYAEDLRNSDKPKEDGCMVLGRWVYDESVQTYDISLETVVFPGDDAVFKEYELNFGGKIKLRIAEKLRKLRRDTNLQYDLVCWIHSHPGLGVFFSNSDDNVQMQLKHAQHPNFLTAFVVDILTHDQELGIFTFRKDGSMNSKGDLTKMYSLENMYKWALESDKVSFNPDNCYDILDKAKVKMPSCRGIELNNSSIIDLAQLVVEPRSGIVGWVVGTPVDTNGGTEFIVSGVVGVSENPATSVLGVVLSVSHFSLPTVQRLIANEKSRISFVLVYSTTQMSLTSIPVVNGEVITDEQFYGDETIDDLKVWTRRKR